ncbi:phosphohydrolase [Dinoroseobacter phage vB_DshS-R4C]|nr:phosphohydrolase [Dinoroseobacter phage vB_DshS-R4C]
MTTSAPLTAAVLRIAPHAIATGDGYAERYMDLTRPTPEDIHLGDIARALSRLCRYTGHGARFYSVAEHSVHCLRYAERHFSKIHPPAIHASVLMHDATEAYLGDVSRPLKSALSAYRDLEALVSTAISRRFGLNFQGCAAHIKKADRLMLATEKAALLPGAGHWPDLPAPDPETIIEGWAPDVAERTFLDCARELGFS